MPIAMKTRQHAGSPALAILLTAISCICPGCIRHAGVQPLSIESHVIPPGLASVKIITKTPTSTGTNNLHHQEVVPPMPIGELKIPDYPENARLAEFGSATVVVRVHLNDAGQIVEITDSPDRKSPSGQYAAEFRAEVEKAVHCWKFKPAKLQEFDDGKDINGDGKADYTVLISTKPIPVYLDVQFEFYLADGAGFSRIN
jgi:hypothetical protein